MMPRTTAVAAVATAGGLAARIGAPAIMIVAGEASGDGHGAALAHGLRTLQPECTLYGMGGSRMAAAGVELLEDVTAASAVGGTEALGRVPRLVSVFRTLRSALRRRRPDALVLVDFPEFNLRLARTARSLGVPVVYFVPPQIWAWRGWRIRTIRRRVSLVLAVFPFERALYQAQGVPVQFVGHPAVDAVVAAPSREDARRWLHLDGASRVVGLLPGSRREEVERMLPLMRDVIALIGQARPETRFVLGLAPSVDRVTVERGLAGVSAVAIVREGGYPAMRAADVVLAASGTATLEAALLGTPMVVVYRVSRLTELMARLLVRVPWIALANLTLGRAVVPELYQSAATAPAVTREALRLLDDPAEAARQRDAFHELARDLGGPGVGTRAASWVLGVAHRRVVAPATADADDEP